jgi:hypothetical protein
MTDSGATIFGVVALAMLGLSVWWTFRALDRSEIDIGRTEPLWLRRRDSPMWFWFWMVLYIVNILMWLFFAFFFLVLHPLAT